MHTFFYCAKTKERMVGGKKNRPKYLIWTGFIFFVNFFSRNLRPAIMAVFASNLVSTL